MFSLLPSTSNILVLHLAGWRDARRRARNGASRWVNNGDGIAGALSHGLVKLHLLRCAVLVRCTGEVVWRSGEDE